jgi:hypothetical protein
MARLHYGHLNLNRIDKAHIIFESFYFWIRIFTLTEIADKTAQSHVELKILDDQYAQ